MSNRIIICEASEIITMGLYEIIQGISGCDVVARVDTPDQLTEKILSTDANMLIINTNLLGFTDRNLPQQLKKEYPQLTVIALMTTYVEPSTLKPYDGVIEINDTKLKVINKMNQFAHDADRNAKSTYWWPLPKE